MMGRPSFLKDSARGSMPESTDRPARPREEKTIVEARANERLNDDPISPEMVEELGQRAIEQVSWPLFSTPYSVQAYGLQLCGMSKGFGYYMEQGLGKTKVTLADFANRFNAGHNDCLIVVTVNSMKLVWVAEMEQERYPFDIYVWPNLKDFPEGQPKGKVIVINYEAIRGRGLDWLMPMMTRCKPMIVFDESTCIANHNSQQGEAGLALSRVAASSRNLAGLPNPNGPHDLFNQLRSIGVPELGVPQSFKNRYCQMGGHMDRKVVGIKNADELARKMKGRVFFASKRTWAPCLPDKLYAYRQVDMTPAQKEAYRTMAKELYAEVDGDIIEIEAAIAKSTKLQTISSGFLYNQEREVKVIGKGENPKLKALKELIDNADGKTIVFAHFKPSVELLLKAFPKAAYALSRAQMKDDELERQKDRFNNDPECTVFIAPTSVMQYGHTLVGTPSHPCTNTVYYENTYSRLARAQSEDRNVRWGASAEAVLYTDIICSPIEKVIINVLKGRGDMAESLISALREIVHGR